MKISKLAVIVLVVTLLTAPVKAYPSSVSSSVPSSVVGISLSKVMAALGGEQESLREEEGATGILMYTADDRIETAFLKLKSQLKAYEHNRKVRIDFLTAQQNFLIIQKTS